MTKVGPVKPLRRGRPTVYRPEFEQQARKLAEIGATIAEIAEFFDINERTVRRWRLAHEEFDQGIFVGSKTANRRVEASLYQQALGYWIDDEEIKVFGGNIVRVKRRTFIPPNVTAAIYWTKVRMGWRDNELPKAPIDTPASPDVPTESKHQVARRIAWLLLQGGRELDPA